jgi:hypothetical protein
MFLMMQTAITLTLAGGSIYPIAGDCGSPQDLGPLGRSPTATEPSWAFLPLCPARCSWT